MPADDHSPATEYSVPHGTTMTLKAPDGRAAKWKCDDGSWVAAFVVNPKPVLQSLVVPPGSISTIG